MLDCVCKELQIGDKVVCADRQYADLLIGEIIGFTPKKARVRYQRSEYGDAYGVHGQNEQLKESYQIFKYEEVKEAYWKHRGAHNDYIWAECSNCGFREENWKVVKLGKSDTDYVDVKWSYCPKCGSIMDRKKENQCQIQSV